MKKMRKDSTYLSMPRCLQQAVDDMLMDGAGLEDVQQRVAEDGIKWSINSISKYNRRWIEPFRREDRREIAAMINKQDMGDLDEATAQLARETLFDLLTAKKKDPGTIKMMAGMVQSYAKLKLDERKLSLLEQKAAEAKRLAEDTLNSARKGLSAETIAEMEERLKLL